MANKRGTSGKNSLTGTSLADQLFGLGNADILLGLGGNDLLDGGTGADRMTGGTGNDTYIVDNSGDRVIESAGQGTDTVKSSITLTIGSNVEHLILTGSGNKNGTLSSSTNETGNSITGNSGVNVLKGGQGHDVLIGGLGTDTLIGGNGDDTLRPGAGTGVHDSIDGGDGFDTVDYSDALSRVDVGIGNTSQGGGAALDVITNVESVIGSRFNDVLTASDTQYSLASGGGGNDTIFAGAANYDRLRGDDGTDALIGQPRNNDDFWLQYDRGMDTVVQFRNGVNDDDHIVITKSEFGLTTPSGFFLLAEEFTTYSFIYGPPVFSNAVQRLLYDPVSHILWADKDGSGLDFSAVPIAYFGYLSEAPRAEDIFVF